MPTPIDNARNLIGRGFAPIPVPFKEKGPKLSGWPKLRLDESSVNDYFNCAHQNIGILTGEPSGWVIDIDLDHPRAVELAEQFLPPTEAVFGREGKPRSHWLYHITGPAATKKYESEEHGMIVEFRSTGCQTLAPGSIHPSGEDVRWDVDGSPATIDADELLAAVGALAEAVLDELGEPAKPAFTMRESVVSVDVSDVSVMQRAAAYLDKMPEAISGAGGHARTYAAATVLVHGFGLPTDTAFTILKDRYNPRCDPPWSDKELRHKVSDAETKPHDRPRGWLRNDTGHAGGAVDLSGFTAPRKGSTPQEQPKRAKKQKDPGPFPPHLLNVPGFIGEVVAHNLDTANRPQPVLALAGAICLQAVLAGRKIRDQRGNRTNLYAVGVAPSGLGKDHARKVNKDILFRSGLIDLEGSEDIASDAGLVTSVCGSPAILFQLDEFGRFLRTIGDPKKAPHLYNVLTVLMKLYSSADTVFRGKAYGDSKLNKVVDQPCASVYGTTVPSHFYESLTMESLGDGFVGRLLVFEADEGSIPDRRVSMVKGAPDSVIDAARWWGGYRPGGNLSREHPDPTPVETTSEAALVFDSLARTVDGELRSGNTASQSLWARAEEKACRLALVYAASKDRERLVVDSEAAEWACAVSGYQTRRLLFVAGQWVADGAFDAKQKRVLRSIVDACRANGDRVSRSELYYKTRYLSGRDRKEVLDNLIETGLVRVETDTNTKRPTTWYVSE